MTSDACRYWAFISYSHHDKRAARLVKTALARESVPKAYRGLTTGKKARFEDVFLDEGSAAASHRLDAELRRALDVSRFLIVICSPFAVASEHVNEEIAYFTALGRADRILCLIASGVPNATDAGKPALECFPAALRFEVDPDGTITDRSKPIAERPLAAELGHGSKQEDAQAIRQLKAGLLGVSTDQLKALGRAHRLRHVAWAAGLAGIAALSAAAGWWAWVKPTTEHYASYVRRWGVWEGVDPVSAEAAARRASVYAFEREGALGRVRAVRYLNGSGQCPSNGLDSILGNSLEAECQDSRACSARFTYNADGTLKTEALVSNHGITLEQLEYLTSASGIFAEAGRGCSRSKSGIREISFERYDHGPEKGLDRAVRFFGLDEHGRRLPKINHDGVYSRHFEYDGAFRVRRETFRKPSGELQRSTAGEVGVRYEYNAQGNRVLLEWIALGGGRWQKAAGGAGRRYTYDADGNMLSTTILGADGGVGRHKEGFSIEKYAYDARGNEILRTWHDADGDPILNINGIGGQRFTYDADGHLTSGLYVDRSGEPMLHKTGKAGTRYTTDMTRNFREETTVDLEGKPVLRKEGYAIARTRYDARGFRVESRYFDTAGAPQSDNCAGVDRTFDDNGNRTSQTCLDGDDALAYTRFGWAKRTTVYDGNGNEIEIRRFDRNGRIAAASDGIAIIRKRYDNYGRQTVEAYFDAEDHPTLDKKGYAGFRDQLDEQGRRARRTFLDTKDQPVVIADGYAAYTSKYDDRGNEIEQRFFDAAGKPVKTKWGYAGWRKTFDTLGNQTGLRYLGTDGSSVVVGGSGGYRARFDEWSREIERIFVDEAGQPKLRPSGYAGWRDTFDKFGRHIARAYVDEAGQPTRHKDGAAGWRAEHDAYGNRTSLLYVDLDGKPTLIRNSYARIAYTYDIRGNEIERRFLAPDGEPATDRTGQVSIERKAYDVHGREVETRHYGRDGKLVNAHGFAIIRTERDVRGHPVRRAYFDAEDRPVGRAIGGGRIAVWLRTFDRFGRVVEEGFLGVDGKPTTDDRGVHLVRCTRDHRGDIVGYEHLGVDLAALDPTPSPGKDCAQ